MMTTTVMPILDKKAIEFATELRARLTRGGLAPEAVHRACEAFHAGDIHGLAFVAVHDTLTVPIPEELLVKVFPQLLDLLVAEPKDPADRWAAFLKAVPTLEYEINRHRGDKKSLTIRWPGAKDEEGPEPTEPEASAKESVAADAATPDPF